MDQDPITVDDLIAMHQISPPPPPPAVTTADQVASLEQLFALPARTGTADDV